MMRGQKSASTSQFLLPPQSYSFVSFLQHDGEMVMLFYWQWHAAATSIHNTYMRREFNTFQVLLPSL